MVVVVAGGGVVAVVAAAAAAAVGPDRRAGCRGTGQAAAGVQHVCAH